MNALGVDYQSGLYETRKAHASHADLVGFFEATGADRNTLEAEWGVLDGYPDISENKVLVIVDETAGFPAAHLDDLLSFGSPCHMDETQRFRRLRRRHPQW